jgi:AAA+ superfamily predicted ATPase
MGLHLYAISAQVLPLGARESAELVRLWNRQAALHPCALFLDGATWDTQDQMRVQSAGRFIDQVHGVLMVGSGTWLPEFRRQKIEFRVGKPTREEQLQRWKSALGEAADGLDEPLGRIVSHFNLSARTIDSAGLELSTRWGNNGTQDDRQALEKQIWKACCVHTRPRIDELAQRIEPVAGLDDVVLPEAQKQVLREIALQVRHRDRVYRSWGFASLGARGLGISALFTGESGTGKTMASEALARELQLDLYRIDLSQVVNKYIGETEKNLKRIFDAAEEGGAILLFDEADALFGKRSEVRDSHDRYSNIEVSYLLQRMEAYAGLAVLTTNMKSALDTSFFRRIRFVVQFPYPETVYRAAIWRRVFPAGTPVRDLDPEKLARLSVPGGNIRNIAINAAFLAAGEDQPVQMRHILRAARQEYDKLERGLSNSEIAGWL